MNAEHIVLKHMHIWSTREMVWGVDDCMLAVADVVKEVTGKDPARRFRGKYKSQLGARRVMGEGGTQKAARDSARALHWRKIKPADAKAGDVGLVGVLVTRPKGTSVEFLAVVCRAPGTFVGRSELGFRGVSAENVAMAWAV